MADVKDVKAASFTAPVVEEKVYVTIPERDLLDYPHPGIGINQFHFGPGTHLVSKEFAQEITQRLAVFDAATLRLLQPKKDLKSLQELYKNRGFYAGEAKQDNA